jgi:nucleoside-diphosphate kinase
MARTQKPNILAIKRQRTLVLIKPDGVQRMLVGDIVHRFEHAGLKLVGLKMVWATHTLIEKHYRKDDAYLISIGEKTKAGLQKLGIPEQRTPLEIGRFVRSKLSRHLSISPVVAMVWQGTNAIANVRQLVGTTDPILADVGSIRGDLTIDTIEMANYEGRSVRNLMHASSDPREAKREIGIWFDPSELHEYENVMDKVLHDAGWDRSA